MKTGRRILITGVGQRLGGALALRLEDRADCEAIFGIDVAEPALALGRTEFVQADTRHAVIAKLIRELGVDTVCHCAVMTQWPPSARAMHETNVIGTMNVLAACAGERSPVRQVVVKSGSGVYGHVAGAPSILGEHTVHGRISGSASTRDLNETEQLVQEFAIRNPRVRVTTLRLGDILDPFGRTPLGRYFRMPLIPTVAGYDPRLQLLHTDDAVEALYRAIVAAHAGVFNVGGQGVLLLSQAVAMTGRRSAPVLMPYLGLPNRLAIRLLGGGDLPDRLLELITWGRVLDTSRLRQEFGWEPAHTTRSVMEEFIRKTAEASPPEFTATPPQERELDLYLKRRDRSRIRIAK